jgi:hypothetical protein
MDELVTFVVATTAAGPHASSTESPTKSIFRRDLVFFDYVIKGRLAAPSASGRIELPGITFQTVATFVSALCSREGQKKAFQCLDNICTVFLVARALGDEKFQQLIIDHLRERVVKTHETFQKDEQYEQLVDKVEWVWSQMSDGRLGLRKALTVCLAYVCTTYDKRLTTRVKKETAKGQSRKNPIPEKVLEVNTQEPILKVKVMSKLRQRIGRNEWFAEEFVPEFMEKVGELVEHNEKMGTEEWEMLPEVRLYPSPAVVDLAD